MKFRIEWIAVAALVAVLTVAVVNQPPSAQPRPSAAQPAQSLPEGNTFAVRDVRIFDGERMIENANLLVRDGLVEAVGPAVAIPAGIEVIDGIGRTILPGLIDAHTHSWGEARRDALRFGVTVEVDLHGDSNRLAQIRRERESMRATDEADLWAAGFAVTTAGGHGTQYGFAFPTLAGDTDVDEFVSARVGEGVDLVKLIVEDLSVHSATTRWPTLSPGQVQAVIVAAKRHQRTTVVHVSREQDALMALRAGADGLAHVFLDREASDEVIQAAREHDAFVVPTLSVFVAGSGPGDGASLGTDVRLRDHLGSAQTQSLKAAFPSLSAHPEYPQRALDNVRRLHAAGVAILAGTDAGNPGTAHGASLHGELELLVRAGMSPLEALRAATSLPAQRLGLDGRGRIAPGLRADLVLVEGDPGTDITATRAIQGIWKNGHGVSRAPLSAEASAAGPAPVAPAQSLIADFESVALDGTPGSGWQVTSDRMMGGASSATFRRVEPGALDSAGALEITGEIAAGFAFPWAGVMYMPGSAPMQPVDFSSRSELVFHARGDGREYNVMLMSGATLQGMPAMHAFVAGADWAEVRLPLALFSGADLARLRGLGFTAGAPAGTFNLRIDRVELR